MVTGLEFRLVSVLGAIHNTDIVYISYLLTETTHLRKVFGVFGKRSLLFGED